MGKTWEECRNRYRDWGTIYEKLQKEFPDYVMSDKEKKVSQSCKILMTNMIDLVDLLDATSDFHNVGKSVSRTTLALGFFEDELVTGCSIDWLNKQQKYQISFTKVSFIVNLEEVVATIQRHLNYQYETDTLDFQGFRNWSWERCRHRFLLNGIGYIKSLLKHAHRDPDGYAKASQDERTRSEKMIALFDLLEADSQLKNARRRIGHNWLFLGLANSPNKIGMSIEWVNEAEKFHINFGRHDNNSILEASLEDAIPTIKRNIQRLQKIEDEQDNNPE